MALVTLEDVRLRLRIDFFDEDLDIDSMILQAEDAVLDYLKVEDDEWDIDTAPARVKAAILLLVQDLFDNRAEPKLLPGLAGGQLNNPVVALLYRLRDPAMA